MHSNSSLMDQMQQALSSQGTDNFQRTKEYGAMAVGGGGISLSFFDVANYAQAIGMIVGCLIVCYQFYKIVKKELESWKRKHHASNDR